MDEVLRQALAPILRDLRRAGLDEPRIADSDWTEDPDYPSAVMWSADGSGAGVSVSLSAVAFERIAEVADQVQEWAIEELWGHAETNWPSCPHHPSSHPLRVSTVNASAVWVCPKNHQVVSPVGGLEGSA